MEPSQPAPLPLISADDVPSPPVRGRLEEWAVLGTRFDSLAQGHGGVMCVEGPPGSGKTRFLSEACSAAERRGFKVFRGGADPDSHFVPLAPLLESSQADGEPLFDAAKLRALATAPEQRFWLLQELQERLERAALDCPLAVVLDDVQWCDDLTLLTLRTLSSRLSAHAILWLVAVRGGSSTPEVLTTLNRMEREGALWIRLGPLSDAAVGEITQDVLGAPPDAATLDVVRRAEGVPLLLVELLHGMTAEGRVVVKDGVARLSGRRLPARFQTSIQQRLHGLSEPAKDVVRAASAIGHTVTVELLAELLDRSVGALVAPVQNALDSDLFTERDGRLTFRHDLIREAVADSLPESVRRALRRRTADIVLARGGSLSEAASLVMDSAERGDQAAVRILRAAATELSETAPSTAGELSRQALDLTPDQAPERSTIITETMVLLWRSGRAAQARALGATALPSTMPSRHEAQVRLGLARVSSQYDFTEAARHAGTGAALPGIPESLRARLLALRCLNMTMVGDFEATARAMEEALRSARQAGERAALATSIAVDSVVLYYRYDWGRAFQRADEAEDIASEAGFSRSLWVPEALWKAFMLNAAGRSTEALAHSETGIRDTQGQGQAAAMHLWLMNRSRVLLDAGRLSDARAEAEAGTAMADELGMGNFADATLLYTLVRVALHTGDRDAAHTYAAEVKRMLGDPAILVRNSGSWLLALMADAEGRPDQAMELLDESFTTFEQVGPSLASPDDPADLPVFVRMALRAGALDRAAVAVAVAEHRAVRNPGFPILAAAAAHARGLLDNDTAHLLHAADLYDGVERLLPHASALEDVGRRLALTHPTDAVPTLDAALDRYIEAGAERDAARVRRRLRALGAPRRRRTASSGATSAWPELTASEVAVVRLVAQGMTNRQVAEHLVNSPHTVSSHLRHAFLKLGLTSRVELARLARKREHAE
ncbi:ATP-binding protein [Streptomyces sp. SLBN-115]|uniref:ATP-binding protein n=1 Tax=Streptomyces sp. SLBN-115 TaxID=2768453 RepID=UPI00115474CA|nr:LuxR family transcriptional regulator [Streptomyces sp. SLBN-115]TQJ56907.1 regulatory LuxR family protein [Streptomyces sp. SLBN-115]